MRKFFLAVFVLSLILLPLEMFPLEAQEGKAADTQGESPAAAQAEPQNFFSKISWFAQGSVLFFPEHNGMASDPMPILPSPGFGASYPVTKIFRVEATLDFYMTHYGYDDSLGRAVPNAIENRTALVIGSLLAFQAAAYFDVSPSITLRVYGGPAADLRIVLVAEDLNAGLDDMDTIRSQTDSVRNYFWSSGRWFMPVMGAGADFALNPRIKLGVDLRVWAPIYRLWTGENLPAIEGWRFGPGIRLSF